MNHSTSTVGNLCQCSVTLKVRGFHHVEEKPPVFSPLPIPSCLVTRHHWKESLHFLYILPSDICTP